VDGRPVELTRKEFDLLVLLVRRRGTVVGREEILRAVWDTDWPGTGRTLDVHVASLRQKLHRPELVRTVRGVGYIVDAVG
jgi:DNA-binding response OmpR family regulator